MVRNVDDVPVTVAREKCDLVLKSPPFARGRVGEDLYRNGTSSFV